MGRFRYDFANLCGAVHRGGNLAFSPDGNVLYSAVGSRVSAFDLVSARSRTLRFECRADIAAIALSPDGQLLLVVDRLGRAALLHTRNGIVVQRMTFRHAVHKDALQFSPCQCFFAVGVGRSLQVWRVPTAAVPQFAPFERLAAFTHHRDIITSLNWSNDSQYVVTASRDHTARVFFVQRRVTPSRRENGEDEPKERIYPLTISGHKDHVMYARFIAGYGLITVARDGSLYCWCLRRKMEAVPRSHNGPDAPHENDVDSAAFGGFGREETERDGEEVEEDDDDDEEGAGARSEREESLSSSELTSSSDGDGANLDEPHATLRRGRVCAEVRLSSKHNLKQGNARRLLSAALHSGSSVLGVGLSNGVFALYELPVEMMKRDVAYERALFERPHAGVAYTELTLLHALTVSELGVTALAINNTGEWIGVGVASLGQLLVWEWRSETHILKQQGHMLGGSDLSFSPDGRFIATGGEDGRVKLWSLASGFCSVTFKDHEAAVVAVTFASKDVVLSASLDATVRAYDLRRYRCFRTFVAPPPRRQFACVAADSAGELVAAGCRDSFEVVVWSLRTGRVLDVLSGHTAPVPSLCFHPVRGQLATASWDGSVRLWELYSDAACEVLPQDKEALAVTYRPDGAELAVACRNGDVMLWDPNGSRVRGSIAGGRDAAPGRARRQRTLPASRGYFSSLGYSADGALLFAGGTGVHVCAYHVADGREPALIHRFTTTVNADVDGALRKLNSRQLTDGGYPQQELEHLDEEDDDYYERRREAAARLPGVDDERQRRRAQTLAVRVSPTGKHWAALTSEGLLLYSADAAWSSEFDPVALDVDITDASARDASRQRQHTLAVRIALRLGNLRVLSEVLSAVPQQELSAVVQAVPTVHFEVLLKLMARRLERGRSLGFDAEMCRALLLELGGRAPGDGAGELGGGGASLASLRALQRSLSQHLERLSSVATSNGYLMQYLLAQGNAKRTKDCLEFANGHA